MKTQTNPHDQIQRTGSQKRKLPLLLALATMLLAASSARATMMINAVEDGGNVVFTLSGNFNTASGLGRLARPFPRQYVSPAAGDIVFSGGSADIYDLLNRVGPSAFGSGGFHFTSGVSGDTFGFMGGRLIVPSSYAGGTLSGSMTFATTDFTTLGVTPGTYEWTWSIGTVSDNLILNIGQSVPDTGSTLAMLGLGLAGMALGTRRWKLATA